MTSPSYVIRPNAPAPSSPGGGGLLVAPRPSPAPSEGAAPTKAPPAAPASSAAAQEDLSPRAKTGDEAAIDPASPSSQGDDLGLSREMSLAELFPAEAAMGAAPPDVLQDGEMAAGEGGGLGPDSGSSSESRTPLVAGFVVTLAILLSGGGFLWWRHRDSKNWQPA